VTLSRVSGDVVKEYEWLFDNLPIHIRRKPPDVWRNLQTYPANLRDMVTAIVGPEKMVHFLYFEGVRQNLGG
jgi:hypothetical protein